MIELVTIKDVAKAANVSTSTVSKVINGYSNLSIETVQRVNKTIAELGFEPNITAKSMRTKKTNMIGIVVPDVDHPFFMELFVELQREFSLSGYGCFVFSTRSEEVHEMDVIKSMLLRQVDGILFSSVGWSEQITQTLIKISERIPLVSLNRIFPHSPIKSVNIDYFEGTLRAMNFLIEKGHRRIAYISGHLGNVAGDDRLQAYRAALGRASIPYLEELIFSGEMDIKSGYRCAREMTRLYPLPSAVVAGNDAMAIGAMKYFKEKGIRVPNDIAVIGFDNIEWCNIVDPPLTTLNPDVRIIAKRVAELMLGEADDTLVLLKPELIVRGSTDIDAINVIDW
ncbi:LacI family DNA-binding transcriptional regulator [Paenibacillus mendelii]|uniref:LacI family DNA-binding transcriptional regulator n=1 Tax=Paenibacillus mendelii TaxID=206163 RepID=A0ABV6JB19_9BACL|nr:LacI family DNA-binding transcriptional regulator [Paenibacillus mendelii]MCQ6562972.1 LacI family transcriptional regulator [Paenibacillus mendelii]